MQLFGCNFSSMMNKFIAVSILCSITFFMMLLLFIIRGKFKMFHKRYGRYHIFFGFCYLICLIYGLVNIVKIYISSSIIYLNGIWINYILYDLILGILGILLTYSASIEFKHNHIKNIASGTLDEHATVTNNEMIEHCFYQIINLFQILFLHLITYQDTSTFIWRCAYTFIVTSPWLVRSKFPIHSFSDNYNKMDEKSTTMIRILYRIKKYQYVFYKHFLLHGLNISVALYNYHLPNKDIFRLYWLLLNTSYVMEFFLQTLVKKKYITQFDMLLLQKILMFASTIAAIYVLMYVNIFIAMASLVFNFIYRKHDVLNTMILLGLSYLFYNNIPS